MDASSKRDLPADKRRWHPSPLPGQVVLVTTVDSRGHGNVATKSWISMAAFGPPAVLMFGCSREHATASNIESTGDFVVNIPGDDLLGACWAIGSDASVRGEDRFDRHGLTPIPSIRVRPPRIVECRAHLECELDGTREWGRELAIFGRIVAASVDGAALEGEPIARYESLAPFFFLEDGWGASLARAREAGAGPSGPRHILTILAVADLEASVRFYRGAFGWPARVEAPVYVELELADGRGLGLYRREAFGHNTGRLPEAVPPGGLAATELYFHCDDVAAAAARLEGAGARKLSDLALRDWGDEAAYFADPDGNVLVVARRRSGGDK
ncbi:MAG: flavin reductase [Planctomycetota bacterium]